MNNANRRNFLKLTGLAAIVGTAGPALVACGDGGSKGTVTNAGKTLAPWPTHVEFAGPKPDMPATDKGVQNLFTTYPTNLTKSVAETPGDGTDVTAIIITYEPPPKDLSGSPRWQAINKALGVNLKVTVVPDAEFATKMATIMASNDLPDIIMLGAGYVLPREADFVASKCADLSDLISGDNIKAYPNLANIPTYAWQSVGRIGGKLYGLPIERPVAGNSLLVNRTLLTGAGAGKDWTKDEFAATMKTLTQGKKWGTGAAREALGGSHQIYHAGSFGAPNVWKVDGGAFTSTYGTEEYKAALDFTRQLWADKVYYPDSSSTSQVDLETLYYNGTVASITDGFGTYATAAPTVKNQFQVDFATPYNAGKTPTPWQGTGIFGYTVLKKAEPDRLKMLLRVCNYLAAPFGTTEYELKTFGIEGADFTRTADGITLKETGGNPLPPPFRYIANGPSIINLPGQNEAARRLYDWEATVLPSSIRDPSVGLRSTTQTENGAKLNQLLTDAATAITTGRKPLSTWDTAVTSWRNGGGDKIAAEFAEELKNSGS
jgi:putative aldouronate transport system substrate-binding protein